MLDPAAAKAFFTPQIPSNNISLALPGITSLARQTMADLLQQNHISFHCYFNDRGFHNHLAHNILASYSLGASPERLRELYESHAKEQRPIGSVMKKFTTTDWRSELGHCEFYASYLEFFGAEVTRLGRVEAIIQYGLEPEMIGRTFSGGSRTFSGGFHPLILLGYGVEYGIDATVAEGLALAALTTPTLDPFVVRPVAVVGNVEQVAHKMAAQVSLGSNGSGASSTSSHRSAIDILCELREDRELDSVTNYSRPNRFVDVANSKLAATKIQKLISEWVVEENAQDIELKSIELYKACILVVGATGLRQGHVKQDFFLMHALTAVLFAYRLAQALPAKHAVSVLKSHLGATLYFYMSRGRPRIDVEALLNYHGKEPLDGSNPWLSLIKRAIDIDEVHVTKVVRACAVADLLFGAEESYSRLILNTAQMSLDLNGDWEYRGVGWSEIYN
ncbi:hypothetical protein BGZ73_004718 [Actinomortierella ambigua]|nr:hypothetical protein BGZ73_004718 [Actinomortierella ambigua]